MLVYVKNKHGEALMPCKPRKAKLLLREGKAKVVKRTPFTIQLLYGSSGYKQPTSLGIDAGTKHIGVSATIKGKVLYEAEAMLRTDIPELIATRRSFRRSRRYRKTRYRKARFLNRTKSKGWLSPSIQHKVDSHLKVIMDVHTLLPVKDITIEVAQFDIQKLKNPAIGGKEYQKGEQLGFWNVREYVLFRDKHTCQHCKGRSNDKILNVHHVESRKTGGDSPANLITLCRTCHDMIHRKGLEHLFKRQSESYSDASQMTVLRWFIFNGVKEVYPHATFTYGYITKNIRIKHGLDKSHTIDARCISENPLAKPIRTVYLQKQVRKNNRQLHKANPKKGIRLANKAERYVKGFQLFDKVLFDSQECFIFGRRKSGYFDIRLLDGSVIHRSAGVKKLTLLERANTWLIERREGQFLPNL